MRAYFPRRVPGKTAMKTSIISLLVLCAALGSAFGAGSVKGTVVLPQKERERPSSFWPRVENGILPIAPPLVSPMSEVVLVFEGDQATSTSSGTTDMTILGADFAPRVMAVQIGTTVEFKNNDRVSYTLFSPDNTTFFGREETAPGKARRIKFLAAGVFPVRTDEFPHMEGTVIVLGSGLFAKPDDRGGFKLDNIPEGKYILKVFFHSAYVHSQPVEVGKQSLDLTVRVPAPAPRKAE
jgi:plastocyanin